ncbi:MAG: PQQ-dependent sugar dehydrogenase, partial [Pirellulales bacterium]|nr:PQQ-dependent sugar dehydrogenase [Pirellulales bacterium]
LGEDINLRVDKLILDGTTYQSEASDTFSTGSYTSATGCAPGAKESEYLYCNGHFEYQATFNPGTLALGTSAVSVNEQTGAVTVPVIRTGGSDGAVTLNYTTVDASATAGSDYTLTAGQVVFLPGETTASIVIPILNDNQNEGTEVFNLASDQTTGGALLGQPRTATITILDDDGSPTPGVGNGLLGVYYDDANLIDFVFERTDTTINFDWGTGSPDAQMDSNTFSVIWKGEIEALFTETYTFEVGVDDGVRLWVDNQLIIDQWQNQNTAHTGQVNLQGGLRHDIRIEYFENSGNAQIQLRWTSASQTLEVVPQSQLYSEPPSNIDGVFSEETIVSGLDTPTAIDFAPDGRIFIAEKGGTVRVFQNGQLLAQPFLDISAEVNNELDRGLLGIAVHPDFSTNPYVYVTYAYDPPQTQSLSGRAGPDGSGNRVARLVRYTADASNGFNTAVPGSGVVLLGTNSTWENISSPHQDSTNDINIPPSCAPNGTLNDCLPADSRSHTIGAVVFGPDGNLFVSNGDGTSFGQVDPRTVRVQDLDSLSGKILRIDPLTGAGVADNPFFVPGDPNANRSKVYSYGLRNPFRFAVRPEDGEPYVSDVGWNTWEEINTGKGKNFGWPFYEGGNGENLQTGGYQDLPEASGFYANNNASPPLWSRTHADGGTAIIAGDFYSGNLYPSVLDGALFFTDFGDPTIRALLLNSDGTLDRQLTVSSDVGTLVEMSMGLDGHMYFVDILAGEIGRLAFAPNAAAAVSADFNTDGIVDGADFLTWQRNFGSTVGAAGAQGDADGDGAVSSLDLAIWGQSYGDTSAPVATAAACATVPVEASTDSTLSDDSLADLAAAYWTSVNDPLRSPSNIIDAAWSRMPPTPVPAADTPLPTDEARALLSPDSVDLSVATAEAGDRSREEFFSQLGEEWLESALSSAI